ncbi:MAG TPA: hypothetical protein VMB04_15220, partial [Mycobacterium sp.]|nr:hypothetical protein [Mycobacterium sp.]
EWFSQCYRDANGAEPPYPAAAAFAAGVLWQRCAKEADTIESLAVMSASQRLDTTTLFGRFHVDPLTGLQTGHQIRVVQWRGGQRALVDRPRSDVSVEFTSARASARRPGRSGRIARGGRFGLRSGRFDIGT